MISKITSLMEALETRNHYTRGYSETISEIVGGMAKEMSFSSIDIENINLQSSFMTLENRHTSQYTFETRSSFKRRIYFNQKTSCYRSNRTRTNNNP
jgi:hypothetical protein